MKGLDRIAVPGSRKHERWLAVFGLAPTRIRFQVPAAERAASYHSELVAPEGVRIEKATLLAGRPNEPTRRPTEDHVIGHDTLNRHLHDETRLWAERITSSLRRTDAYQCHRRDRQQPGQNQGAQHESNPHVDLSANYALI